MRNGATQRRLISLASILFTTLLLSGVTYSQSLPKTFVVDGEQWEVAYNLDEKVMDDVDGITLGDEDKPSRVIFIRPGFSKVQEKEIFMHELLHVAVKSTNAEYVCRRKFDEEEWIERIESRFATILEQNPQILEYFGTTKKVGKKTKRHIQ